MSASESLSLALPKWTRRIALDDGGRDPLGLSRVADKLTEHLLQGITTQTRRARYYSFYSWVLWHIAGEEGPTTWSPFEQAFRRRDTLFATASLAYDKNSHVVGVDTVGPRLKEAQNTKEVRCDYRALPASRLGAFEEYYVGSLYNLGLWSRTEDGIYHPSQKASRLAQSFHTSIEATPYIGKRLFLDNSVSWAHLQKTKDQFNLDRLSRAAGSQERDLLTEMFFHDTSAAGLRRRDTLLLILFTATSYEAMGSQGGGADLDWDFVYAPYYYDKVESSGRARRFRPSASLTACHSMWRQFCLHEYLAQSLEHLLTGTLEALAAEPTGLHLNDICDRLFGAGLQRELTKLHSCACATPAEMLRGAGISGVPDKVTCQRMQQELDSEHPWSEHAVIDRSDPATPEQFSAVAVSLLTTLYAKWRALPHTYTRQIAGAEVWAVPVLTAMDRWWTSKSWNVLQDLLYEFVLQQHDRIMYEKGLKSRWLDCQDGKYIKEQDYDPVWRSTRHHSCLSILKDLGMVSITSKGIATTQRGRKVLHQVGGS